VFAVDDGALCGYLESGVEHGYKAGQMAVDIINGKPAGQIPIITAPEGQSMLNLHAAETLSKSPFPPICRERRMCLSELVTDNPVEVGNRKPPGIGTRVSGDDLVRGRRLDPGIWHCGGDRKPAISNRT
jgi:hypothetical protein